MKHSLFTIFIFLLICSSCHRHSSTTCTTTVTIIDSPGTYTSCGSAPVPAPTTVGAGQVVPYGVFAVTVSKPSVGGVPDSDYNLSLFAGTMSTYALGIAYAVAAPGDTNTYTLQPRDSFANTFYEGFSGKKYECSGGTINILSISSGYISGTFSLTVFDAVETKNVYGTFTSTHPYFN